MRLREVMRVGRRAVADDFAQDFRAALLRVFERFQGQDGRAFAERVARGWLPSWLPAVERRRALPVSERERQWQLLRRGRYIEFNLLYDRGVKFGLDGGGDVDAVMVSAPPLVAWAHRARAESAEEEKLMEVLRRPRDWA